MLNAIIRFSLRFRGVIFSLAVVAAGYGLFTLTRAGSTSFLNSRRR
jgi:Cu/Ag efflux pump CusA